MVFLGGAVLANLVSFFLHRVPQVRANPKSRSPTRTTCGYPSRSGRNKARAPWQNSAHDKRLYLGGFIRIWSGLLFHALGFLPCFRMICKPCLSHVLPLFSPTRNPLSISFLPSALLLRPLPSYIVPRLVWCGWFGTGDRKERNILSTLL